MFSPQNTLVSPSLITCIGVNISQKSLSKPLRHLVSFAGTWPLHLGVLRKLHIKLWFCLNLDYAALIWSPHWKLQFKLIRLRKFIGQQPAGPAGNGETQVVSAKCLMSLNGNLLMPGGTSPPCFSFTRFIFVFQQQQNLRQILSSKICLSHIVAQVGYLNFSCYVGLDPSSTVYPQKISRIKKNEILATQKSIPILYFDLKKRP